jgi:site-specific DNA-methyltransferase (adenine-specific)
MKELKIEMINDNFQNYKRYGIPKAQLVIADIPYNISSNAYASSPLWYRDGDRKNGESKLAKKSFFDTDDNFHVAEFMAFCSHMLIKEPKEKGKSPCMIVFCSFAQQFPLIELSKSHGFKNFIPLTFVKNYSAQVLKANMRIVGACEHAVLFYRDKLPKFNNDGRMVFDWFPFEADGKSIPKIHPTQKPVNLLKGLIGLFTDKGDYVIDPCAGSGTTLRACAEMGRGCYGFEIKKQYVKDFNEKMMKNTQLDLFVESVAE